MPLDHKATADPTAKTRVLRGLAIFAALFLLNAMLTFHNVWPTLFVRWPGELSVELAGILLLMIGWQRMRGALPRGLIAALAVVIVLGTLGRYAEVTAPALYGREINLYWDLQHAASLTGMLTRVTPPWLLIAAALGIVASLTLLYLVAHWSLRLIATALQAPRTCARAGIAVIAVIGWFMLQRMDERIPDAPQFSTPVSMTYAEQVARINDALSERGTVSKLPPSPAFSSSLSLLAQSDVMVVFIESYGRVTYDRREILRAVSPARAELQAAAHETQRDIASAFVESPTFGGGSWLAHLSFLSGIEVRDARRAQLLMTQSRRTFGTELAEHGYRRVALMPGLKKPWPEGAFYGFDRIYDDAMLEYRGPAFGWWRIPDQFSLIRLDAMELTPRTDNAASRKPLFTFFTTVSSHAPFRPTPPYQPNWPRLLTNQPFDAAALQESLTQTPQWSDMSAGYTDSVAYSLQTLAGFVRTHAGDNLIMIILGDHQPPAFVSGVDASWDVPVHVITSKPALLAALMNCGFVSGVTPAPATVGSMHQLAPTMLHVFEADAQSRCPLGHRDGAAE